MEKLTLAFSMTNLAISDLTDNYSEKWFTVTLTNGFFLSHSFCLNAVQSSAFSTALMYQTKMSHGCYKDQTRPWKSYIITHVPRYTYYRQPLL